MNESQTLENCSGLSLLNLHICSCPFYPNKIFPTIIFSLFTFFPLIGLTLSVSWIYLCNNLETFVSNTFNLLRNSETVINSGVFRGAPPAPPPPTAHNFLDFKQFSRKYLDKIVYWRPPGSAPPPTGNPGSAPHHLMFQQKTIHRKKSLPALQH